MRGARKWIEHGDGFLATTRAFTPASGDLSEQFDQRTGEQTSAKHLGVELRRVHFLRDGAPGEWLRR